jgi:hypothetical protein
VSGVVFFNNPPTKEQHNRVSLKKKNAAKQLVKHTKKKIQDKKILSQARSTRRTSSPLTSDGGWRVV